MSRRFRVQGRSIGMAIAAVLFVGVDTPADAASRDAVAYPPRTILLFVAGWCAPCRAEVARLDAIAAAAAPFAVRVVLAEDTRAGREMLRGVATEQRWQPDAATLRRVQADLFADTAGLPYSIAIDERGARCADRRDGLDAARVRSMVEACYAR